MEVKMPIKSVNIDNMVIYGYEQDYVFNTIKNTQKFYENTVLEKWTPFFQNANTILDIGANLGNHTLYWANKIPNAKIYSFEPYDPNFEVLSKNVSENHLNNITVIHKGIGDKEGKAEIKSTDPQNFGSTSLEYYSDEEKGISMITVDSFYEENCLKNIDFIKIDVEGFEIKVLKGMPVVLTECYPDLWVEVSDDTCQQILEMTVPLGYVLADVENANILLLNKKRHPSVNSCDSTLLLKKMLYFLGRTNEYYQNYITAKQWFDKKNQSFSALQDVYEKSKEQNQKLIDEKKDLAIKTDIINQKYKEANENYARIKEWYHNLQSKNSQLYDENTSLKIKFTTLEETKKSLENQCNVLLAESQNKTTALQEIKRENILLEQDILTVKEEFENFKEQFQKVIEENSVLKENLQISSDELSNIYQACDEDIQLLEELKRLLQKMETQNSYLKNENIELRRKLSLITDTKWGKMGLKIYYWLKKMKRKWMK